jgi:site-specific recombinase XerD
LIRISAWQYAGSGYRRTLGHHCDDLNNRDPSHVKREDVKRTFRRWPHASTQRKNRAILVSFYDWAMEEGDREDNPARQTRRPKSKPPRFTGSRAPRPRRS